MFKLFQEMTASTDRKNQPGTNMYYDYDSKAQSIKHVHYIIKQAMTSDLHMLFNQENANRD